MILHRVNLKHKRKPEQKHQSIRSVTEYKGQQRNDFLEVVYEDGKQLYKIISVYKKFGEFADMIALSIDTSEIDKELAQYNL